MFYGLYCDYEKFEKIIYFQNLLHVTPSHKFYLLLSHNFHELLYIVYIYTIYSVNIIEQCNRVSLMVKKSNYVT